jgi:glycosyltransferase involved in cell wall biosynthesis
MIVAIDTNCILPGEVGGIENYTLGLIEALKLSGSPASKLLLLTRPENRELFEPLVDHRTETLLIERPKHKGKTVSNWSELLRKHPVGGRRTLSEFQRHKAAMLHQRHVDLVHFPGNTVNPLDLDLPVVLNLHDLQHRHFPQYFTNAEIDNREKWWVASAFRADALLAASNYVRDDLHRQLHVDRRKIFVTPDVFQQRAFSQPPTVEQLETVRDRFALGERFFLYPAAVWPHKNHERLIRAFVAAQIEGAQLVLTGGGQKRSSLPRLIEQLGAEFSVRLAGRVSTKDLVGLYHMATGLIFPSEHEAWSIPVMEAMACGCPVACSNVTSLPEEVGDAGLIFSPTDIEQMADAMRQLAENSELRRTLSERGRARVKLFGPEQFLQAVTAAYCYARMAYQTRKAA